MENCQKLSVIVPVFNELESLEELVERLECSLTSFQDDLNYEIILVDDGSTDGSREKAIALADQLKPVKSISLRANFGKSMALMVGFLNATGELVATMDADLQDNPEDIPLLIEALDAQNLDVVSGWRVNRKDTVLRRIGSWFYNKTTRVVTGLDIHDQNCGLKLYRREQAERLSLYGHFHRYLPMQAKLLGFKVGEVPVKNSPRKYGSSKYKTMRYEGLFDFLSVLFLSRFGYSPMHFFGVLASLLIIPALSIIAYLIGYHFYSIFTASQVGLVSRPLLDLSLTILLTGVIIAMTGLVCDFVLYHHARVNKNAMVEFAVREISKGHELSDQPETVLQPHDTQKRKSSG